MDGRVVGRGGTALMIHAISQGRALPLAWRVRQGPKGHCPEDLPIAVVELRGECLPAGARVVLLGDGECDGTLLQKTLHDMGWSSVCRTAVSTVATGECATFRLDVVGSWSKPGRLIALPAAHSTREAYGPIMVRCCGATGCQEPRDVVCNIAIAEEPVACINSDAVSRRFSSTKKVAASLFLSPIYPICNVCHDDE